MERQPLDYSLIFSKKRRTIAIHVKGESVSVRAPLGACKRFIDDFVQSKRTWIEVQLQKHSDYSAQSSNPLSDNKIMLFGDWLDIKVSRAKRTQLISNSMGIELVIAERVNHAQNKAKDLLLAHLSDNLRAFINERLEHWQSVMAVQASSVKIRSYKRRWGSCNQRRELSFNTFLVGAPKWVIDYVIVHELAHIRYMNHGKEFWRWVDDTYEHTNQAKLWLKQHGQKLELNFE